MLSSTCHKWGMRPQRTQRAHVASIIHNTRNTDLRILIFRWQGPILQTVCSPILLSDNSPSLCQGRGSVWQFELQSQNTCLWTKTLSLTGCWTWQFSSLEVSIASPENDDLRGLQGHIGITPVLKAVENMNCRTLAPEDARMYFLSVVLRLLPQSCTGRSLRNLILKCPFWHRRSRMRLEILLFSQAPSGANATEPDHTLSSRELVQFISTFGGSASDLESQKLWRGDPGD